MQHVIQEQCVLGGGISNAIVISEIHLSQPALLVIINQALIVLKASQIIQIHSVAHQYYIICIKSTQASCIYADHRFNCHCTEDPYVN